MAGITAHFVMKQGVMFAAKRKLIGHVMINQISAIVGVAGK